MGIDPKQPTRRTYYDDQPRPNTVDHMEWQEQESESDWLRHRDEPDHLPEQFQ